jgi:hypothetical protein
LLAVLFNRSQHRKKMTFDGQPLAYRNRNQEIRKRCGTFRDPNRTISAR